MSSKYDVRIITTREGFKKLDEYAEEKFNDEEIYGESNPLEELNCYESSKYFVVFGWDYIPYESDDIKYKIIKQGLKMLEDEGHIYSVTKNINIAESVDEYKYIPPNERDFTIPPVPLTYEFDDAETRVMLKGLDNDYENMINEMECDME